MIRYISGFGDFCEGLVLCYCFGLLFLFVRGGQGGRKLEEQMCDFVCLIFVHLPPMAFSLICLTCLIEFSRGSLKEEKPRSCEGKGIETLLHPEAEVHLAAHSCL